MADLIEISDPVVTDLGFNITEGSNSSGIVPDAIRWDCSIGGNTFLFAMNDQDRMQRETSEFRRQRIDNERNPGEQSLDSGYWIRSQSSWHYGMGITSAEPLEVNEDEARFRYATGGGVNVWTPGQVSLLNDTAQVFSASATSQLMLGVDTGVLHAAGSTLTYVPLSGSASAVTWGGSGAITSLTSDGSNYYVADATGIYKGTLPTGTGSKIWDTGAATIVRWVKSRLMATVGTAVYELTGTGPTLPTPLDPGTARPSGWTWTDIAEGPSAVYLSGYVGDTSTIEKVSVTATTSTVTLDVPVVVADMPRSETVQSLYSYVGAYLIVGTSKGCRVASIQSDGSLALGPLVVESSDGCRDAVAVDNFVYVTVGSKGLVGDRSTRGGLYRINLGQNLNQSPLLFAYAADLVAPAAAGSGAAHQVTIAGGSLFFTVTGYGVVRQQSTFVSEGWLETGRIRLGTVESKAWRDVRLLGDPGMSGSVEALASTSDSVALSAFSPVITVTGTSPDLVGRLTTAAPSPASSMWVAFKLSPSNDRTVSSRFNGYQLRAVPAPRRTELISVPVLNFDFEVDRMGARYGAKGNAWSRFQSLKQLEASAAAVSWIDFTTGEQAEAVIERVSFRRTTPPTRSLSGNGGIVTVLLRLV